MIETDWAAALEDFYAPAGCGGDFFRAIRIGSTMGRLPNMSDLSSDADQVQNRVIEQIVELQREFYFENKGKETERRRRLRDLIERATSGTEV